MPSKKVDFETVRQLALALPGVEESTSYGAPSCKLRGRLLTCQAINRSAEPNSLGIVLMRLGNVRRKALEELLDVSWAFVGSEAGKRATHRGDSEVQGRHT